VRAGKREERDKLEESAVRVYARLNRTGLQISRAWSDRRRRRRRRGGDGEAGGRGDGGPTFSSAIERAAKSPIAAIETRIERNERSARVAAFTSCRRVALVYTGIYEIRAKPARRAGK